MRSNNEKTLALVILYVLQFILVCSIVTFFGVEGIIYIGILIGVFIIVFMLEWSLYQLNVFGMKQLIETRDKNLAEHHKHLLQFQQKMQEYKILNRKFNQQATQIIQRLRNENNN